MADCSLDDVIRQRQIKFGQRTAAPLRGKISTTRPSFINTQSTVKVSMGNGVDVRNKIIQKKRAAVVDARRNLNGNRAGVVSTTKRRAAAAGSVRQRITAPGAKGQSNGAVQPAVLYEKTLTKRMPITFKQRNLSTKSNRVDMKSVRQVVEDLKERKAQMTPSTHNRLVNHLDSLTGGKATKTFNRVLGSAARGSGKGLGIAAARGQGKFGGGQRFAHRMEDPTEYEYVEELPVEYLDDDVDYDVEEVPIYVDEVDSPQYELGPGITSLPHMQSVAPTYRRNTKNQAVGGRSQNPRQRASNVHVNRPQKRNLSSSGPRIIQGQGIANINNRINKMKATPSAPPQVWANRPVMSETLQSRLDRQPRTQQMAVPQQDGYKVLVRNLHVMVTLQDIKELFGNIGPLVNATMLEQGSAEVFFVHEQDARSSVEAYNNRLLDGMPMSVILMTKSYVGNYRHGDARRPF